jgi:hypothetical protein
MFPPPELPTVAVKSGVQVRRERFREEQLAFAQGTEGNRAGWVGAFLEHGLGPIFSSAEFWPESFAHIARQRPKRSRAHENLFTRVCSELHGGKVVSVTRR